MFEAPRFAARGMKCAQFLFLGLFLMALAGSAQAATLTVNCSLGPGFTTIQAAVNASAPGDVIVVTGTCNESVSIDNHLDITIQASSPGSATIVPLAGSDGFDVSRSRGIRFVGLIVDGGNASSVGIDIENDSLAFVQNCTIRNNPDAGVNVFSDSQVIIPGSTIQGNGDGVDVNSASRAVIRNTTIVNNSFEGVFVLNHSFVAFQGTNEVANNGDTGAFVIDLSKAVFQGNGTVFTTVEGNATVGIVVARQAVVVLQPGTRVRNNGGACPTDPTCGGIFAIRNSTVRINTADISSNLPSGIAVQQGIDVGINNTTITNNTGDGVRLQRISIGDFTIGGNTFAANGGASVFCDTTSLAVGDLSGVANISCRQIERPSGPPRPGRVREPNP